MIVRIRVADRDVCLRRLYVIYLCANLSFLLCDLMNGVSCVGNKKIGINRGFSQLPRPQVPEGEAEVL